MNRTDWTAVGLRLLGVYFAVGGLLGFAASAALPRVLVEGSGLELDSVFRGFALGASAAPLVLGGALALFAGRLAAWFERFDGGRAAGSDGLREDGDAVEDPAATRDGGPVAAAVPPLRSAGGAPSWQTAARRSRRRRRGPFERLLTNSLPSREAIQARRARRRRAAERRRESQAGDAR